ncbi:hypothetical protein [Priestia aryabhattai]
MIGRQGEDSCGESGQARPRRSASDEEAHRPPAESEALQGNQRRCHKRFSLCIPFVGLSMSFLSLCLTLIFLYQFVKIMHMLF